MSDRNCFNPQSYHEFRAAELAQLPGLRTACCLCGQRFSLINTHNRQAWVQTQQTGTCEDCNIKGTENGQELNLRQVS